jgi:serine/threonine-protein phosphatase 2A regulatory subunit A
MLGRQLGEQFFNDKLSQICLVWLKDSIYTVRESAVNNYKQLTSIFGEQWAIKQVFPTLQTLSSDISYLHRLTVLFSLTAFAG